MNNKDNLRKTNELKLIDKKPKKSFKGLFISIIIFVLALAIIIALAFGINIAKKGGI